MDGRGRDGMEWNGIRCEVHSYCEIPAVLKQRAAREMAR
jgi:hypothetical protein